MMVWKDFMLENVFSTVPQVRTLFDNIDSPENFANDLEYFKKRGCNERPRRVNCFVTTPLFAKLNSPPSK